GETCCSDWEECGEIRLDLEIGRVFRAGEKVDLSERELALLRYLIERRGTVVSRDELLLNVWGYSTAPTTRTVDVHIAMLRQKLERDPKSPELIVTVHSQGYRFIGDSLRVTSSGASRRKSIRVSDSIRACSFFDAASTATPPPAPTPAPIAAPFPPPAIAPMPAPISAPRPAFLAVCFVCDSPSRRNTLLSILYRLSPTTMLSS